MAVIVKCNVCGDSTPLSQDEDVVAVAQMLTFSASHQNHADFSVDLLWSGQSGEQHTT